MEFREALTEQCACRQLKVIEELKNNYYTNNRGFCEVYYVVDMGEDIIPLEVKSMVNLKAKSPKTYQEKFRPKLAIRASMADFKRTKGLIDLPLYTIEMLKNIK